MQVQYNCTLNTAVAARELNLTTLEKQCQLTLEYIEAIAKAKNFTLEHSVDHEDVAEIMLSLIDEGKGKYWKEGYENRDSESEEQEESELDKGEKEGKEDERKKEKETVEGEKVEDELEGEKEEDELEGEKEEDTIEGEKEEDKILESEKEEDSLDEEIVRLVGRICADFLQNCSLLVKSTKFSGIIELFIVLNI